MRKIRIFEHISLDGVIEHEDGYAGAAMDSPPRFRTRMRRPLIRCDSELEEVLNYGDDGIRPIAG